MEQYIGYIVLGVFVVLIFLIIFCSDTEIIVPQINKKVTLSGGGYDREKLTLAMYNALQCPENPNGFFATLRQEYETLAGGCEMSKLESIQFEASPGEIISYKLGERTRTFYIPGTDTNIKFSNIGKTKNSSQPTEFEDTL